MPIMSNLQVPVLSEMIVEKMQIKGNNHGNLPWITSKAMGPTLPNKQEQGTTLQIRQTGEEMQAVVGGTKSSLAKFNKAKSGKGNYCMLTVENWQTEYCPISNIDIKGHSTNYSTPPWIWLWGWNNNNIVINYCL